MSYERTRIIYVPMYPMVNPLPLLWSGFKKVMLLYFIYNTLMFTAVSVVYWPRPISKPIFAALNIKIDWKKFDKEGIVSELQVHPSSK
jgi:hypothetical protein